MTLQEIGLKHKTDKATTHLYMDNYEKYLSSWRDKEFVLLELGVAAGNSISMWREAFPKAKIFGIDNNPDCAGEGIFIGSQIDTEFLDRVLAEIGIPDVVIDDCSHYSPYTIQTFEHLFPKIAPKGLYFVEDCSVFYNEHYSEKFEPNGRSKIYNFFVDMAYHVDVAGRGCTGNAQYAIDLGITDPPVPKYSRIMESMHIHPGLWLFKRK